MHRAEHAPLLLQRLPEDPRGLRELALRLEPTSRTLAEASVMGCSAPSTRLCSSNFSRKIRAASENSP